MLNEADLGSSNQSQKDIERAFDQIVEQIWQMPYETTEVLQELIHKGHQLLLDLGIESQPLRWAEWLLLEASRKSRCDDYYEALQLTDESFQISKAKDYLLGQLRAYRVYSYIYGYTGMLDECLDVCMAGIHMLKSNKAFHDASKLKASMMFSFLNNMATIYSYQDRYEESISYYQEALSCLTETMIESRVLLLCNLSEAYTDLGQFERAFEYSDMALKLTETRSMGHFYYHICHYAFGLAYEKLGNDEQALSHLELSLNYGKQGETKYSIMEPMVVIGRIYLKLNRYEEALDYLLPAIVMGEDISANELLRDSYRLASECYEHLGIWHLAMKYLKIQIETNHKVASNELEKLLSRYSIEMKVEQTKKDAEIYKLRNVELKAMHDELESKALALEESNRNIAILSNIGHEITSQLDIESLLNTIYENVKRLMKVNSFGIGFYTESTHSLEYRLFIDNSKRVPPFTIQLTDPNMYSSQAINERRTVVELNLNPDQYVMWQTEELESDRSFQLSLIYHPLILEDQVVGIITVQSVERFAYSENDVEAMKILGTYIAIALKNSHQSEALKKAIEALEISSTTDPLTGLYNRRYITNRIQMECDRFIRYQHPYSIIVADIDFFKDINDSYGHDCGDFILVELSKLFKGILRKQDEVARWGGEEFLILLTESDVNAGAIMAERVRALIEKQVFVYNEQEIRITLTLGISEYAGEATIEEVIKRADRALYKGKHKGRNRCEICHAGNLEEDIPILQHEL